jgi:hypothetical protein
VEEALEPVREFTDLVEDVLMELAKIEQSDLETRHRTAIDALEDFYNERAWEYPAALIMRETAEGPNKEWVVNQAEQKLEALRGSYMTKLEENRRLCADAGLLPDASDYPADEDDVASAISDMMRTVDRTDDRE